jgi:tetratricopeptide (TPR) repeat protein
MKLIRYISIFIVMLTATHSFAQSWTGQAFAFYKADDLSNAKTAIDSAINTTERFDSQTWQLRGIIYRNISSGDQLYYREIALESFIRAKKIDSTGLYTVKINDYLRNTIVRYFNDAVTLLMEDGEFEKSEESYNVYIREYKKLVDPNFDFTTNNINYYNAIGSEYLKKVDLVEPSKKMALREKAIEYSTKVLAYDTLDFKANFNIGIVYYNIGVDYVITIDPDGTSLEQIILNQKKSEEAFLKDLPYLHRAERLQPNNKAVQVALMGSYYGLNNMEMYLKYQKLVDQHNLGGYLERYNTHPDDIENARQLVRVYTQTIKDAEQADKFKKILYVLENP